MIRFLNVTYEHQPGKGINGATFSLARGDFALLSGPNGAGKTTILRLIYLDLQPQSGQIIMEGSFSALTRQRDVAAMRRRIGLVFSEPRLLPDRTVAENIALPLRILGESRKRALAQVTRLLYRFSLKEFAKARPTEISSGEQKKAAIARALATRPFLLLADEPLANLDSNSAAEIVDHLRQINQEGTTILAASHIAAPFTGVAQRTLNVSEGKLVS